MLVRRAHSEYSFWTSSGFSICFHLSLSAASPILFRRVHRNGRGTHESLDALVHGEDDGLTGGDTGNARRDALVECRGTFFPEHLGSDGREPGPRRLALESSRTLNAGPGGNQHKWGVYQ